MSNHSLLIRFGTVALMLIVVASSAVAQDDQDLNEKFEQGQSLVQQGKMDEAIKVFRNVTETNEDFGPGWFFLGYSLHMNGDIKEAIKAHKKAAEFDQFAGIATYNVGCAHALMHNKDGAIEALQQAVELGFDDLDQIEMDEDLHSLHTDVRFAKLMVELDGKEEIATKLDDAETHIGSGDFAKAAEVYSAILKDDANNAFATYRLGYSLHGAGDLDAALEMHKKAAKFDSVAPIATYNIACVHSLNDNKDEAFASLKKAVDLGFIRPDALADDPDLENIRSDDRFEKLVAKVKEMHDAHSHGDHDHDQDKGQHDDDDR